MSKPRNKKGKFGIKTNKMPLKGWVISFGFCHNCYGTYFTISLIKWQIGIGYFIERHCNF